ncbi:UDP-N-acetylmuramoyl-tripeptide--D-alanyl-D-alanine ligase [Paenibacillus ginsengarvi]|uniref:UDP-N-acetylmuramoyl-tripeptide--D-alanyl-D-alanine ligase n=1 Tax=Paenibacillus ginsengarvi TaxID=400777 RepID=A0A3B0AN03_9BACL|nr:UDP-N-acetylmuramoyl-tripeptide--D-alanyl-D-alanine ligase [Paenibacillus ginsengarvi]RKN61989.1 UDP-N-acetylmuramoyl-tripeptide--D-alanyl-D-alanine ligase [Paenibacillus ginsengarvi]
MITRTISQLAAMAGAESSGYVADLLIRGVCTDTRNLTPGSLFVPIRGLRFNGHQYVKDALERGAVAALWAQGEPDRPDHPAIIEVEDTLAALQRLAKEYRRQLAVSVIGITGSNGKTSTKDLLAALLSTTFRTHKTNGNLNNHLGVPLTLLGMDEETEIAVIEMGMSAIGEIAALSAIAGPDAAVITSVSEVHLGDLGTRDRIVQAKLELVQGLRPGGLLAYCGDYPQLVEGIDRVGYRGKTVSYGVQPSNDLHPIHWRADDNGFAFVLDEQVPEKFASPIHGRHQMVNALGAIAVARHLGVPEQLIREGLYDATLSGMRNEVVRVGRYLILNDTYKSNPSSVRAALQTLYDFRKPRRKIALLGDMVELGEESEQLHRSIGAELDPERIDLVITVGASGAYIAEEAARRFPGDRVVACADKEEAIARLNKEELDDSLLLIKGSRVLQLERIIEALRNKEAWSS